VESELLFRLLALLLLVMAFSISGYFRRQADREGGALDRSQGGRLLIVLRLVGLIIILPLLGYLANPEWVAWARLPLPEALRWVAGLVALSMVPVFYWIFSSIGQNISPTQATRAGHNLVTSGPYRYVRHPLYTAGLLFFLSLSVLTALWWLGLGLLLASPILLYRTPIEEAQLEQAFGEEYRRYRQRTGRYLPRLGVRRN
jgi:protein-S-isoprenylcysteine O-methyltransferase Ste14